MSTAPHLWRKLLEARARPARGSCVVDPFRSRTARVADEHLRPLPGTDARARARDDARDRRRRPRRRGVVPRARRRLRRAARAARRAPGRALGGDLRRAGRRRSRAIGARVRDARSRRCCASASAPSATSGAPIAYRTIACLPALVGAWRHRGGGCSYIPTATAQRRAELALERADLRPGPVRARSTCRSSARRSPTRRSTRRSRRSSCWNSNPAADRARPGARARRPAPRGPVHASCSSSS